MQKPMGGGSDHYSTLGVSRAASQREIKIAYLENAKKIHPDKLTNLDAVQQRVAAESFKCLQEAYETLMDTTKRKEYDLRAFRTSHSTQRYRPKAHSTDFHANSMNQNSSFNRRKGFFFFFKLSICLSVLIYSHVSDARKRK